MTQLREENVSFRRARHSGAGVLWLASEFPYLFAPFQRIQTISATDPDEPLAGHRFFFRATPEAGGKANFSVHDNKGSAALASGVCLSAALPW